MTKQHRTHHKNYPQIRFGILFLGWMMIGLFSPLLSYAQTRDILAEYTKGWKTVGPPKGKLMIIGGAASPDNYAYFMELIGGPDAPIVFIPTAGDIFDEKNKAYIELSKAGAKNITILHTKDRKKADTEAFAAPLRTAKAVFIGGGFQSRLAAAYLHTLTHQLLFEILERGGIVAGSSAGASIQGSYLYGGGAEQKIGFGFVKKSAIGQHYIRRNRMGSVARILKAEPDLFGFGVDEATAAVVHGNELEVIGEGKVALYDPTRPGYSDDQLQEYLFPGDKYDMAARRIIHRAESKPQDLWLEGGKKQWQNPTDNWQTIGPPQGKLLLYGTVKFDPASIKDFLISLDSPQDSIVVLSTGNDDMYGVTRQIVAELQRLGAGEVTVLHTINSDVANSFSFAKVLGAAKAVWICDNRSWQLADAYLYTLIHKELFDVLQRNGVVGGNGDGATMVASRLFGEPEKYGWHTGYGFVRNTLIVKAPHSRKTLENVQKILNENTELQGVALTKDSKLVIEKNQIKVEGDKAIKIYKGGEKEPIVVSAGALYELGLK